MFNVSIESQILYHAPLSFKPTWGSAPASSTAEIETLLEAARTNENAEAVAKEMMDDRDEAWLIDEDEMKVFVNSERWSLGELCHNYPV